MARLAALDEVLDRGGLEVHIDAERDHNHLPRIIACGHRWAIGTKLLLACCNNVVISVIEVSFIYK